MTGMNVGRAVIRTNPVTPTTQKRVTAGFRVVGSEDVAVLFDYAAHLARRGFDIQFTAQVPGSEPGRLTIHALRNQRNTRNPTYRGTGEPDDQTP